MRITACVLLVLLPYSAFALDFQNMDQASMEKMMQNMQKMQMCMSNINEKKLKKLQASSEKFASSIKSLCKKGKRDEAQEKAISYSEKFVNDPTMKQMKKCGAMAKGMMPDMSIILAKDDGENEKGKEDHVCDSMED
ncbi:MAG: hypothetical protein OEY06_05290 [Gammaproteobacteria bacterium]|nr:hypothetical protein [Gammaproteobacteria bacterium]